MITPHAFVATRLDDDELAALAAGATVEWGRPADRVLRGVYFRLGLLAAHGPWEHGVSAVADNCITCGNDGYDCCADRPACHVILGMASEWSDHPDYDDSWKEDDDDGE